jgi:hypothetical protein
MNDIIYKERRKTTKKFIEESKNIHGDKYDYDKVNYINSKNKVIITCKIHGEFEQIPNNHLNKSGCPKCSKISRSRKLTLTQDEFIKRSNEIHKGFYTYFNTFYVNSKNKVIITCKIHGDYKQYPQDHLRGHGCVRCENEKTARKRTKPLEKFIEEAKNIHGDKYDYDKVNYINNKNKVIITCKIHGEFEQSTINHLKRQGCRICGYINMADKLRKPQEKFIEEAINIHENTYDYDKVNYINSDTKVIITCDIHGDFEQRPSLHLLGSGCKLCGIDKNAYNRRSPFDKFIEKSRIIHGNTYSYDKAIYLNCMNKLIITCHIHGDFEQIPNNHLRGASCPQCSCSKSYSLISLEWMDFIEKYNNIKIKNIKNGGEFTIPTTKYKADGYCEQLNSIYEFHGDYWHGNPLIFDKDDINQVNGKTFGELYNKTKERKDKIISLGYNYIEIWENDWILRKRMIVELINLYSNLI